MAHVAFHLLIYGVNDVFDQETDARNPRKGTLEGARIDRSEIRPIALGVIVSNVPFLVYFALFVPPSAVAWMLLYALLFVGYSVPPARFKARPYLDSLSNAAYAFPLVFVPLGHGEGPVWPAAIGSMAWSAAKHTFDAVQDVDEDRKVGIDDDRGKVPHRVVLWSGAFWMLATVCFALVWPVAIVNAAIAGTLLDFLYESPTPQTGHRLYKHSIAFPYVAGRWLACSSSRRCLWEPTREPRRGRGVVSAIGLGGTAGACRARGNPSGGQPLAGWEEPRIELDGRRMDTGHRSRPSRRVG